MYDQLFLEKLDRHLILHYQISINRTDVFEDTLLKMAGIKTKPTECHFHGTIIAKLELQIKDLTQDEIIRLISLLSRYDGNANATYDASTSTSTFYFAARVKGDEKTLIESLLKSAGITTLPTASHLNSSDDPKIWIKIKGLTQSDLAAFKAFLARFDENVIFNETDSEFYIDAKIAETQILPEFINYLAGMKKEAQKDEETAALFKYYQDTSRPGPLAAKYITLQCKYYQVYQALLAFSSHDELILSGTNEKLTPEENKRINEYNLSLYKSAKQSLLDNYLMLAYSGNHFRKLPTKRKKFVEICKELNLPLDQILKILEGDIDTSYERKRSTGVDLIATAIYQEDLRRINSLLALTSKKGLGLPADMERLIMSFVADNDQTTAKFAQDNTNTNKKAENDVKLTVISGSASPDIAGPDIYLKEFFRFFSDPKKKTRHFLPTTDHRQIQATCAICRTDMVLQFCKIYRSQHEIIAISTIMAYAGVSGFETIRYSTATAIIPADTKLPVRHYMVGNYNKEIEKRMPETRFTNFTVVDDIAKIKLPDGAELIYDSTPKPSAAARRY